VARRARRFANAIFASSVHGTTACYYQWQSRPQPCFDELHRATKPHNAYVDAPVHAADQKFSKKLENHEHAVAIRCVYYNFARIPSIVSRHASNGSRRDRSCLDSRRNYCFACLVKMNLGNYSRSSNRSRCDNLRVLNSIRGRANSHGYV